MKKKLSLVMIALMAVAAFAATMSVTMSRRAVTELTVISEATTWDFSKLTANTSSDYYASEGIKLTDESTPTKNEEFIYANYLTTFFTADASFKADAIAFKGEYPIRKNKYSQNGILHFKTSVAGKIVVSFNDTGSTASTTAVKRYLVVNDVQTEYWTSRENNGESPYAAQLNVTSGEIEVPAGDVTITGSSAIQVSKIVFTPDGDTPSTPTAIVYDFAAEQALIAAGTVEKPGNVGGNQNNGQGFNAYSVKIRNDYKGYSKKEGSTLPEVCHIWRRTDRFDQDASWNVAGGVAMPNDREFAIDGLTPGSKVVIEYDATNAAEGSKDIIWAVGENNTLGEAVGAGEGIPVATATIGGVEAVPGETAIASGAEILVKSVTPAVKGTGYIVIKVKKNMVISKISILVNEDAVSNAVTVADGIENGTVKVNRTTAFEGDDVYVTATPAEGYGLEAITVKDADGADVTVTDGKFTMPAKAVTVSATFVAIPKFYIFGDVTETGWNAVTTEMTFNVEAQAYEYEFEATKDVWFAFSDTEFAVTDGNWEAVNAARYSLGGTEPTIGTAQDLVKGVDSSIKLSAGTWKVSVSADMKTLTITGEVAPPPAEDTYVVAGAPASLFGTEWSGNAEANKMTKNTETGLYELKFTGVAFTAATTIEYKIVKNSSIWIPDGVGNNQTVSIPAAGTYDITFTFNPEGSVITGVATVATGIGIINVDGVNDIFSDGKPVYNLSGQRVFKGYKGVVIKNGKKIVVK